MPINIIIEDGTNTLDANSYISVAEARQYAANRGYVLSADDDIVSAMLVKAMDYIEAKACQFQGTPTYFDQSLQWPRNEVLLAGYDYPNTGIPKNLKNAQASLVLAVHQGLDLMPNTTPTDFVIEETVGPITTKYANPVQAGIMPSFTAAEALLAPLYGKCGLSVSFITMRV